MFAEVDLCHCWYDIVIIIVVTTIVVIVATVINKLEIRTMKKLYSKKETIQTQETNHAT